MRLSSAAALPYSTMPAVADRSGPGSSSGYATANGTISRRLA